MTKKEIAEILKPYNEDIKRHMGALSEDFQDKIKVVAELALDIKKTVDSHTKILDSHTEMIGNLAVDVETLKNDMKIVKEDIGEFKDNVKILKDDMVVVKSDLQIIKTDVEPRVAKLEAMGGSHR